MANTNAPFGLRFVGLSGAPPTSSALMERRNGILSTNTTAIFTGDLIIQSSNGYLYQWAATNAANGCYGVFCGCRYASNSQQTVVPQKYWPGTDAATGSVLAQWVPAFLTPPPVFVIQCDATGITNGNIGMNADVVVGTGSTTTGFSAAYLDTTTICTTNTLPLTIIDLWANWSMGNNPEGAGSSSSLAPGTAAGAYNWAIVAINSTTRTGI